MPIPFKSASLEFDHRQLFPSNVFDLLSDDHDCYLFKDLLKQLDTSVIESQYSYKGQHAYHPNQIVSILIYGYSHGVFSSRELEKRCNEDLGFMYIAGMNCPNFRVLSDFRKNNAEFFQYCFKQTVKLAVEMQLASLGHVSLDGSKFKANTSKHKAMSYKFLKAKEQALGAEIDNLIRQANAADSEEDAAYKEKTGYELPEDLQFKQQRLAVIKEAKAALEARESSINPGQPIADKKQISFADSDARIMCKNGNFDYSYSGQISVDSDNQIIIGQHVSQNSNDKQEVDQALASIKENAENLPDKMSLDNGYQSGDNLESLEQAEVDAYVAVDRGEKSCGESLADSDRKLHKSDFVYDEESDCFTCPNDQRLPLKYEAKNGNCVYQGNADICAACPFFIRCCQSKTGQARTINTDCKEGLRQAMRVKMEQTEAKEIYKQRKVIVEPVFGQIKNSGFRGFSVRGKDKVAGEFSLICATHNIKKMVKSMVKGLVRPNSEITTMMAA